MFIAGRLTIKYPGIAETIAADLRNVALLRRMLEITARPRTSTDEVRIRAAIATLSGPQRQVLAEAYYRDRSVAETARILQIPPGTVKSRTYCRSRGGGDAAAEPRGVGQVEPAGGHRRA